MKRWLLFMFLATLALAVTGCNSTSHKLNDSATAAKQKSLVFEMITPLNPKDKDLFKASIIKRVVYFGYQNPRLTFSDKNKFKVAFDVPAAVTFNESAFRKYLLDTPTFEIRIKQDDDKISLSNEEKANIAAYNKQALALANKLLKMVLAKPNSFADLAKKYSQDPGSKENGGLYTGIKKGQFVPEYDAVIFGKLKPGEIYPKVVESTFGYHIIKKEAQRGTGDKMEVDTRHILIKKEREHDLLLAKTWRKTGINGLYISLGAAKKTADNKYIVEIKLNQTATAAWKKIIQDNPHKEIAIFVDGMGIARQLTDKSFDQGYVPILANFSEIGASKLADRLSHGVLEMPIRNVE